MFIKLIYTQNLYLIKSDRVENIQRLVEITEKVFEKLPTKYSFSYKDHEDDDIIIGNT